MRLSKRFLIASCIFLIATSFALKAFLVSVYRLPILMYHSIDYPLDKSDRMTVSPEIFTKQMRYLHDKRYNVIPIEEAVFYIKEKRRPPPKTIAITMDDGYENNYKYAYPVLKRYKIPATIFVITDLVGKEGFLSWSEIKEMSDSNIIDIGSHTKSHQWLTGLAEDALKDQVEGSKKILEEGLGKRVDYLCYPMGGYDERVKAAAREAGYEAAFATKPIKLSPNYDLYEIKRVRISPFSNNLFVFVIKLSGYHAFFRIIQNDYKYTPYILWKKRY